MHHPPRTLQRAYSYLLLGLAALISLGMADYLFRIASPVQNAPKHKVLVHEVSDNLKLLYKPSPLMESTSFGVLNRINSAGFRDRKFTKRKSPGTRRIGFLGDSVVYGYALQLEDTLPKQLETQLLGKGISAEVLNLGVSGYEVCQSVEFFKEVGIAFHPDIVLLGYTLNDSIYASLEADLLHDKIDHHVQVSRKDAHAIIGWLFDHSAIMGFLDRRWHLQQRFKVLRSYREQSIWHYLEDRNKKIQDPKNSPYQQLKPLILQEAEKAGTKPGILKKMFGFIGIDNDPMYASHWEFSKESILELQKLSKQHHFRVIAVIFPYLEGLDQYALKPVHEFLAKEFESFGFEVIDTLPYLQSQHPAYGTQLTHDGIHFTPFGSSLVSRYLADCLTTQERASQPEDPLPASLQ